MTETKEVVKRQAIEELDGFRNWEREDFVNDISPYVWIDKICNNIPPLKAMQYEEQFYNYAQSQGLTREFIKKALKQHRKSLISNEKQNFTEFTGQPLTLYCGDYACDDSGVTISNSDFFQEYDETVISHPILPVRRLKNIETGTYKYELSYRRKNRWKSVVADNTTIASTQKILELASHDISVDSSNAKEVVKYLTKLKDLNYDDIPEGESVSRLGWFKNEFMPYSNEYIIDNREEAKALYESVNIKGDFDKWVKLTHKLRKNKIMRLIMAGSFASPLIGYLDLLPFIIHLWGTTGTGKTVALRVASSIWGNPKEGQYWISMNNTKNSYQSRAGILYNLPFIADDLQVLRQTRGQNNYDSLIYELCTGIERNRLTQDAKQRQAKTWKNSFIFSGEEPIVKANSNGGAVNRVLELPTDGQNILELDGFSIVNALNESYGKAGVQFITRLQSFKKENPAYLSELYNAYVIEAKKHAEIDGKMANITAVIKVADDLANELFYKDLGEETLEFSDILKYVKRTDEIDVSERAYEFIVNDIAVNDSKFNHLNNYNEINSEIWGKHYGSYVLINKTVLSNELKKAGFDFESIKKVWADKGYLIKNSQGRYAHSRTTETISSLPIGLYIKISLPTE